jgi:LacI family transcriptional regulator
MAQRPTIRDIAENAGVSVATVNRVLAGFPGVRAATSQRVADAARAIGYHAAPLLEQQMQATLPQVRLGFVLHKERQSFYRALTTEIADAVGGLRQVRATTRFAYSASQAPGDFASALDAMKGHVDVLACTAVNHQQVSDTVAGLRAAGIPVFAMLSDFALGARAGYIGLDNLQVGRGAARMLALAARKPGKIAIFVGGHRWHGHELREAGMRSYFREHAPDFAVLDALINLETRQLTYEAALELLARHPDLRGIYVAGGGMEGAIAALREVRAPGDVALVVNELTSESQAGLADGFVSLVCATPLETMCGRLLHMMLGAISGQGGTPPEQVFLKPDIYLPEFF